ncbi:prepilin peptidase [Microbulbifer sp. 2304DJ12-6]|uniref:prepilin peptidase n=1 Tax=Microbulbifer sp. 2304DJ12-6 TaxID=3233340 RepID=UPI0039AF0487
MLDTLIAHPALLPSGAFLLGLLIGSFLNVVILRLPVMMERDYKRECYRYFDIPLNTAEQKTLATPFNLMRPHSRCPHCRATIKPWQNIPVISYLFLRGRCGACGAAIAGRYPLVELITGVLTAVVVWQLGFTWQALAGCGLTWALVALTGIDFDKQLLPDSITLPLLWAGLLVNLQGLFVPLEDAVIGAAAGYGSLWLVFHGFKLATGKEGMGAGDFKILAAIGAWFGWQMLPMVILLSAAVGAVAGITWSLVAGRDRSLPIAFGPYLAGAGWIAMLWGDQILRWYLNFAGLGR